MTSYLTEETQSVVINGTVSPPKELECGVPRGSVMGKKKFMIYIELQLVSLQESISKTFINMQMTPNCMPLSAPKTLRTKEYAIEMIQNCTIDIKA